MEGQMMWVEVRSEVGAVEQDEQLAEWVLELCWWQQLVQLWLGRQMRLSWRGRRRQTLVQGPWV